VEIGKYKLKYLNDQPAQTTPADFEKTMVLSRPVKTASPPVSPEGELLRTQTNAVASNPSPDTAAKTNAPAAKPVTPAPAQAHQAAAIQILNGPNAGKELELVKSLTTLGKPGVQVAVLARRPHGFFITHVEGAKFPLVNGDSTGEQPHQLNDHDIIELAGVKMEFYFKS
jgi:hypothetical protein